MTKIGKISSIKKEYSNATVQTMETSLAAKNLTRVPGTAVFKYPYKERTGKYRTGLDPDAAYLRRIVDDTEREAEIEYIKKLKEELEQEFGRDLSPTSDFWNYALSRSVTDTTHVQPAKLSDGDNFFSFDDPFQKLTFAWLRVHPTIASSLEAYKRGEFPADTQFYVADDEVEAKVTFKKKQRINKAIVKFDEMTPSKKKKIARMLGLPVTDNTKEEEVYNMVDTMLKQTEIKSGELRGMNPINTFNKFADMGENILHVRDIIKQAIQFSIIRKRADGTIYEGEFEVAKTEDEFVKKLVDDDHQEDLIMLEQKLKAKKISKA